MDTKWSYVGSYVDDGITYEDCARECMEKEICAGFDVWNVNKDCQLFLFEAFFGDGTPEEECFLKDGFAARDPTQLPTRPDSIEGFTFE